MAQQPILCPNCLTALQLLTPPDSAVRIECPKCKNRFVHSPHGPVARPLTPVPGNGSAGNGTAVKNHAAPPVPNNPRTTHPGERKKSRPAAPAPPERSDRRLPSPARRSRDDEDPLRRSRRKRGSSAVSAPLVWGAVAGGFLLLCGVGGLAAYLASRTVEPGLIAQADLPNGLPPGQNDPPAELNKGQKRDRENDPEQSAVVVEPDNDPLPPEPAGTEKPLLVLDPGGHGGSVRKVLFTPDGREVVSVSRDKTVRVADVASGETLKVFRLPAGLGSEGALYALALTRDGRKLAVAGMSYGNGKYGYMIYVLDMAGGGVEQVLRGHRDLICHLDFTPDGQQLASSSNDGTVRLYDLHTGECRVFAGHKGIVRMVAVSPDGEFLATASLDNSARVWHLPTGILMMDQRRPAPNRFASVAWNASGRTLATGCLDGTVQLWNVPAGAPQPGGPKITLRKSYRVGPEDRLPVQINALAFSPAEDFLLYAGVDFTTGRAGVFDLTTGKRRFQFTEHDNTVMHGSLSPDGTLAATVGGDRDEILIWNTDDGRVVQRIRGGGQAVWAVGWSPDGKGIAWGYSNDGRKQNKGLAPLERTFRFPELVMGGPPTKDFLRRPAELDGYSAKQTDFADLTITKDGQRLSVFHPPVKGDRFYSHCLLPGGRAVAGTSSFLYLVDLESNRVVREYRGHSGEVTDVSLAPDGRLFLTGSTDRTLCLWDPALTEPLLTLFVAGQDWICWTPQGYYAASPNGERLMGWLINHGPDNLASYYPAAQFRRSLYHPEAIKLVAKTGSLAEALRLAGKKGPAAGLSVAQVLPPTVSITSPAGSDDVRVKQPRFEVKATAKSVGQHPVTALRLLVDGRPFQGQKGLRAVANPRRGTVQTAWTVELAPGKHSLVVQAESAVSKALSRPRSVVVAGDGAERPNLYVLAVGISAYPGRMALKCAAADAIAIDRVFQEKSGRVFGKIETKLLTDRQATKANILRELAWLGSQMALRDVGVIFFAGHGGKGDDGTFYLIPVDALPRDAAGTCISGDFLKGALEAMPGKVVAMLDACHSGSVADGFKSSKGGVDDLMRDLVTEDYGVVVMCSSAGEEYSIESEDLRHGFFTLSMVEALSGKADFNRDGIVYIHEADAYATLRVQQLSRGMQNPVTARPAAIRTFPLSRP